jgi:hypothetical protein
MSLLLAHVARESSMGPVCDALVTLADDDM